MLTETTGFPTLDLARAAAGQLRTGSAPSKSVLHGGTTHAHLRGKLTIGEPTPGGPPDVEQVWGPGVHTHGLRPDDD